jgi:hypothetical protein
MSLSLSHSGAKKSSDPKRISTLFVHSLSHLRNQNKIDEQPSGRRSIQS